MILLLAFLERFAHLLPQALRIEIACFITERVMQDFRNGAPLARIARTELRLQALLAGLTAMRWRALNGLPEGRLPRLRGGRIATHEVALFFRLSDLLHAFSDIDGFIAAARRARIARQWKALTRAPRRLTATTIRRAAVFFRAAAAVLPPVPARALELSG